MVQSGVDLHSKQVGTEEEQEESDGADSITSSPFPIALQPVYENGRRYCNEIYFMPNDEPEQTRLSIVHQAFLILLDGELTTAPLPPEGPARVLDVGTGPGDWAVEMGQRYPNAEIIATDISIFDEGPAVIGLPNVHFQLDDAEDEWSYHHSFDIIHFRGLSGAFRDWRGVYQQAYRHLKPGGFIEVADSDPAADIVTWASPSSDSAHKVYVSAMRDAAESLGYPRGREHLDRSLLMSIGFVDVAVQDMTVPIGAWPEDAQQRTLGKMVLIACLESLEARSMRPLTATGRWTTDDVRDLCEKVKQELMSAEGLTISVRFVTARKPEIE